MSVPDYNDPLRHTNLPSPHPSTTSISRVRGDSRHMIDVCLWRNQEGAQINFSLSSFDFVWLIYFLTPSQDAARRTVNEKSVVVVCGGKLLKDAGRFLSFFCCFFSPICRLQLFFFFLNVSPPLVRHEVFIVTAAPAAQASSFLTSNWKAAEKKKSLPAFHAFATLTDTATIAIRLLTN